MRERPQVEVFAGVVTTYDISDRNLRKSLNGCDEEAHEDAPRDPFAVAFNIGTIQGQ